jgi:hypothetical protein
LILARKIGRVKSSGEALIQSIHSNISSNNALLRTFDETITQPIIMILKIDSIVKSKKPNGECVLLEVLKDTDLKGLGLIAETTDPSGEQVAHLFEFPSWEAKQGDYVRVYTGEGTPKSTRNLLDSKTHFFYWNNENTWWDKRSGNLEVVTLATTRNPENSEK